MQMWITITKQDNRLYFYFDRYKEGHEQQSINVGLKLDDAQKLATVIQGLLASSNGQVRLDLDDAGFRIN